MSPQFQYGSNAKMVKAKMVVNLSFNQRLPSGRESLEDDGTPIRSQGHWLILISTWKLFKRKWLKPTLLIKRPESGGKSPAS